MAYKRLQLHDGRVLTVYPLTAGRAHQLRVALARCGVWGVNTKGHLYTSRSIRVRLGGVADITSLDESDIKALANLGFGNPKDITRTKEKMLWSRDYERRIEWLTSDADGLRKAGVKLASGWQAACERAAKRYADKRQRDRRARLASVPF